MYSVVSKKIIEEGRVVGKITRIYFLGYRFDGQYHISRTRGRH